MLIKIREAQSTAEYAILISVIVGAALAMQVYIKRSLQAKMKGAANYLTDVSGDVTGDGKTLDTSLLQYEPYYAEQRISDINRETAASSSAATSEGGALARTSKQDLDASSTATEQTHTLVIQE